MEDGAKEDPAQNKEPKFLGKAGWVKKAHGKLVASYKDRYIHVERTEIVVYENEDLQNCLERFDLENYDQCHELKSPFKRKHRLILIRSPKTGNKVHDVKLQAQTAEEKEAWIKALLDGINRAKNKIFDEVHISDSSDSENVNRTRPKGNRDRRPPTRIHMKEVADVSSDGILRLDLDLEDATMPNGTHHATVDGTETPKEATTVSTPPSSDSGAAEKQTGGAEEEAEPEVTPPKKVLKPPMPPTKEVKPSSAPEDEPDKDDGEKEKQVLKPPMPPSKNAKPCASPAEEATEDEAEKTSEKSPDVKKKTGPPPTPPNKPSSSSSIGNLAEASQSRPDSHPPTPPSKEKKPSHAAVEPDQEVQSSTDETEKKEEGDEEEAMGADEATEAKVGDDKPESPGAEEQVSEEESEESSGVNEASDNEPQLRKSPSPPLDLKKKPDEPDTKHTEDDAPVTQTDGGRDAASLQTASDTSASSPQAEESPPEIEVPPVVVSLNDSLSLLSDLPGEKKKKTEEKSVDSGQHSDDDSAGSGSEDTLAASTAALRGSLPCLDVLDASEDDIQTPVSIKPTQPPPKPLVRPKVCPCRPTPPLKPSVKVRSASSGDLLSDSSVCIQAKQQTRPVSGGDRPPSDEVTKLETEVALEMEKTRELLSTVNQSQGAGDGEGMPQDLLAKAMEKLQKADHVLREVNKLKLAKSSSNRKSW
ncbi:pleckstrin homology domain-containing family O member 2 [Plectropomus leopardus]|uniref:pleckstrin homology domain-containing family O member 2 n=1 Tax=Plectropomus leopardus TaxID=160734 RepID=UPI001C4B059A|nr:pleckstrin homology domain-containing family O member 2 [Plectropomus leopardus]